jgi:CysZ protein
MKTNKGFFPQVAAGFSSYFTALNFLFQKGLWIYLIYPVIISGLLLWGGFALASHFADEIERWIAGFTGSADKDSWLGFMTGFLHVVLAFLIKLMLFFVFSSISKFLVLILMSPVMSLLSDRTEEIITGVKIPFDTALFVKNFIRGILIALRNTFIQVGIIVLCFLICWIPVLGWISPLFLLLTSYYFYGFSMMDYVNERRKMGLAESVSYVRSHKALAITNGFVFSLLFAIPFIGIVVSTVLAPVAACIAILESEKS